MSAPVRDSRADRLDLRDRLDLARHAGELLRLKEEALRREQARLEGHAQRTGQAWEESCLRARVWLLRARALGAGDELALLEAATPTEIASVTLHWHDAMGVSYPGEVGVEHVTPPSPTTTAALRPAADAYRVALDAAAAHAAASMALRKVAAELAATRRRRRAIENRLVPTLETRTRALELRIDEDDRDHALRTHLAVTNDSNHRRGT